MLADSPYSYDVFISYSTQDETWVRGELLQELEQAGLRVCIDFRDFRRGAPTISEIERLMDVSRRTLVVLTPHYIQSEWTKFETLLLQTFDPANRARRLIPLFKKSCDIPRRIQILTYIDFVTPHSPELPWTQLFKTLREPLEDEFVPEPALKTPPQWYLAHPYGMPPNFTGRNAELQTLSNWLHTDVEHPVFVLRALGGFGKSALTWHWITHYVDAQQWPQVVWWSFYEASADFNSFLQSTLTYLTGQTPEGLGPQQQLDQLLGILQQRPVLIVMDGFERELRAYSGMDAAYQGDEPSSVQKNSEDEDRNCVNIQAETFLHNLANLPNLGAKC